MMIEALLEGVLASPLSKYASFNLRVCRPLGLQREDLQRILDEVIAQIGLRYDVKHILDLARYFFPVSLIPRRLRRRALQFGSGLTTQVICSSIIGRAFQNVGFPILPATTPSAATAPARRLLDRLLRRTPPPYPAVFRRQLPSIITPRDFDLSPYFEIIKFNPVEARHAEVAREMAAASGVRRLFLPTLDLEPYREKPAGYYWLVACAYGAFGVGEAAARAPSALAALIAVLALYAHALPRWGLRAALGAGLVAAT